MKICYVDKSFSAAHQVIIDRANNIIEEYASQGFRLTLRQLYYQFVSRDWIPNKQTEYKRLGSIVNDARLAGEIDWDAIEDRGRNLVAINSWDNPESIVAACARQFRIDLWEGQEYQPEVWIEKEALAGVIEPTCDDLRVPFFACKGYTSQSEMHVAGAERFREYLRDGRTPVVIHLGDHDPSGIDMTRDIRERLSLFFGDAVDVRRVALNFDQVEEYGPPPNPAKVTDSRFDNYQAMYGDESWELDALNPDVLASIIREAIEPLRDDGLFEEKREEEDGRFEELKLISANYEKVVESLSGDSDA